MTVQHFDRDSLDHTEAAREGKPCPWVQRGMALEWCPRCTPQHVTLELLEDIVKDAVLGSAESMDEMQAKLAEMTGWCGTCGAQPAQGCTRGGCPWVEVVA